MAGTERATVAPPPTASVASVVVARPAEDAWAVLTDWTGHGRWIPATRVRASGEGLGARIEAWTGAGPLGFLDEMVVTEWVPPYRAVVDKVGAVLGGRAGFTVVPLRGDRCRVTWWEDVTLPGGAVTRPLVALARPGTSLAVRAVLERFRREVERRAGA